MRHYGASRRELFERLDKPHLLPLTSRFEYAEWSRCTVNIDYHVVVDGHFYSVPHNLRAECKHLEAWTLEGIARVLARQLRSPDEALAEVGGVNVHVGSAIDGNDRQRLERVCRYMTRPPVCQERLELSSSGQVVVRFKRAWRSGAHAVMLAPLDFIGRLVALIPAPHYNLTRYHGVFAARAKQRSEVVPGPAPKQASAEPVQLRLALDGEPLRATLADEVETKPASRHPWAYLLQRVFAVDVMTCSLCQGPMRLVKIASTADEVARGLAQLGLGPRPPPRTRPELPGQRSLAWCG